MPFQFDIVSAAAVCMAVLELEIRLSGFSLLMPNITNSIS